MLRHPIYLAWLIAALAAVGFCYWRGVEQRRRISGLLGSAKTLAHLIPMESIKRRQYKFICQTLALVFLFLALSGPQWGVELVESSAKTRQIVIAVDTSLSMAAEDIKPSRLEEAKREISVLLDQLNGNRIAILSFSGEPALICPLTTDPEALQETLDSLGPDTLPVPGTGIGKAITLATQALMPYPGSKSIILLTDGEDHHTDPEAAAAQAAAAGVQIYAIGIATPDGSPIPMKDSSGALTGYKKDRQGNTVISRLGEKDLSQIAAATHGAYFRVGSDESEAATIAQQILKTTESQGIASTINRYQNHFEIPLALAFILLLVELLVPERDARAEETHPENAAKTLASSALLILLLFGVASKLQAATTESDLREGNALYTEDQYQPALEKYTQASNQSPADIRPVFNAGDALFRLNQMDEATKAFTALSQSQAPAPARAAAYYNLGDIHYQQGNYGQAVEDFRKAVALNPQDAESRYNLAVALRALKNPPPKKKQQQNQQKNDQNKQQNKNDKNNQPQGGKQNQSPKPQPRPQDQMSQEDAQRIMRAVAEREKSQQRQMQNKAPQHQNTDEDW